MALWARGRARGHRFGSTQAGSLDKGRRALARGGEGERQRGVDEVVEGEGE